MACICLQSGDGFVFDSIAYFLAFSGYLANWCARAVLIGLVGPMLTIIFSWWLLNEPLSAEQLTGTILVVCGLLVIVKR
ncbi:EamA family transporter [Klebsiella aerogenes]|nr:EamA family transporter [Klebsiella aerogenes]